MRTSKAFFLFLLLFALTLMACQSGKPPNVVSGTVGSPIQPATFSVLPAAQGEIIEYGAVKGANSLAAAMGGILKQVDQGCGEKPSVGQVFRVQGSTSVAVFFTVVDHAQANRQLAGMVIAVQGGSNDFEAGLVADSADRFARTANPMMQQLFGSWSPGASPAAPAGGQPAVAAALHTITTQDRTASAGIPDGWTMFPGSHEGLILLTGPKGEHIILNQFLLAWDPTAPGGIYQQIKQRPMMQLPKNTVFYPFNVDMAKSFADVWQAMLKGEGQPSQPIQIASAQNLPTSNGMKCVHVTGQLNPGASLNPGGGMQAFNMTICADPGQAGQFAYHIFEGLLPNSIAAQESATELAIMNSFQVDQALLDQIVNAEMAPILKQEQQNYNQMEQSLISRSEQIVNQIHQIGQQATQRMNATEDSEARNDAGFDNYLLDQSVVSNGSGHQTDWNSEAYALVQSNPGKYQIVDTPNYWQGVDY
ncbi:MAG: hypothetical protein ABSA85_08040 [Terracidiphilus sp.]|jgi:hypothetical protein